MAKKHTSNLTLALSTALIILVLLTGYFVYKTNTLNKAIAELSAKSQQEARDAAQMLNDANTTINQLTTDLSILEEDYTELKDDYRDEKKKNDTFQDQIDQILGTVGNLDKLSKTDEELLQKYSKVYFLNENYIPSKLRKIDNDKVLAGREEQYFHGDALPFLNKMIERAKRAGIDLKVVSAYRSFDTQTELKNGYVQTYGTGANTFSADQGYSEHQLGTTVDLTDPETAGTFVSFENTDAYQWLQRNAYRYGFVLSYPKNNEFYVFEPWHWRFVGTELAEYLHDEKLNFYDLDQRTLDKYLLNIFD